MTPQLKLITLCAALSVALVTLLSPWSKSQDRALVGMVATLNGQWVGRDAPPFSLADLDGQPHTLAEYQGKVIFLNFWGSFCAPCREEMPSMERLVRDYQSRGLVMVAVSLDPEAEDARSFMQAFLPGQRSAMTVLHDPASQTSQLYGTELLPETYIIDRQGRLIARFVNAYDWTRPEVRQLIEHLLAADAAVGTKRLL
jgi:thiol-disulfide isomerase/thioredoxin